LLRYKECKTIENRKIHFENFYCERENTTYRAKCCVPVKLIAGGFLETFGYYKPTSVTTWAKGIAYVFIIGQRPNNKEVSYGSTTQSNSNEL
jgi:hypothetical protein